MTSSEDQIYKHGACPSCGQLGGGDLDEEDRCALCREPTLTLEPYYHRDDVSGWPQDSSPELPFITGAVFMTLQKAFPNNEVTMPQGYAPFIDVKAGSKWIRLSLTELE